jgi:hypothetical protein
VGLGSPSNSLQAIAAANRSGGDEVRAKTERTSIEGRVSKTSEAKARERAAVWENVADLVRHSKIGE